MCNGYGTDLKRNWNRFGTDLRASCTLARAYHGFSKVTFPGDGGAFLP